MMSSMIYRKLQDEEVEESRQLSMVNPDVFAAYALDRLPSFYEIADTLESIPAFVSKQRLMMGAFSGDCLAGAVFVAPAEEPVELEASDAAWDPVLESFSDHEINVFCTLASDLRKAEIAAPSGSLLIHSLCVAREHRGKGIAKRLLAEAISQLSDDERSLLYIKIARVRGHMRLCESVGFRVVQKRLSLSDRLQFGCWGSTLLKFAPNM